MAFEDLDINAIKNVLKELASKLVQLRGHL
jgi:hypothetical protein